MTELNFRLCPPELRQQAFQLVLRQMGPEQVGPLVASLEKLAAQGVDVFATLWVAMDEDSLIGASWVQPMIGKVATLWLPQFIDQRSPQSGERLAQAALKASRDLPVHLIQTLVPPEQRADGALLSHLGFEPLATLHFLRWELASARQPVATVDSRLSLTPGAGENRPLLKQLLADSYLDTLDCPRLDGLRQLDDTIDGYQSVGEYQPGLWSIVMWQGQPAGVVLINLYSGMNHWELVYMGLAPRFRGQGLGRQLLELIRREGIDSGVNQVVLAVDAANVPARQIYEEVGFTEWGIRLAYILALGGPSEDRV